MKSSVQSGLGTLWLCLWFLGLMFFLPFLQYRHYYPITDFYSEWVSFALGIAALFSLPLLKFRLSPLLLLPPERRLRLARAARLSRPR